MTDTLTHEPTLDTRLSSLPPKVAIPLRSLFTTGQISEPILQIVLDAGELAQDTSKLLAFAAGFLYMRAQGIPVHDVIAMAKNLNRRINLAWSPARWGDEHQRLSRAEALSRMAEDNITYDVSDYEKHLPKRFAGYLIRSSRRLGMEGLRQRHCVASYHDRLQEGTSAIAAVFVDKQRWTVELKLSQDPKAPLRIAQIKTRYNGMAPASVRQQIHDILGIELPSPPAAPATAVDSACLYMENLRRLLPVLREHNIETVEVFFDGSGDSGSIESIEFKPSDRLPNAANLTVEHLTTESFIDDGQWRTAVTPQQSTLGQAIETLAYDYLEEVSVNWEDNDGGFGDLIINVPIGTVSLDINVRYIESTTEYSSEIDIETGETV